MSTIPVVVPTATLAKPNVTPQAQPLTPAAITALEASRVAHTPPIVIRAPEMGNAARAARIAQPFTVADVDIPVSLPEVPFDPSDKSPLDLNPPGVAVVTSSEGSGPLSKLPEGSVVQNHAETGDKHSSVTVPATATRGAIRIFGERTLHAVAKAIHFLHAEREKARAARLAKLKPVVVPVKAPVVVPVTPA